MSNFPRILILTSNNFNLINGGGITLTNLFRGWPADSIANLHEDSQPEDESVCKRSRRLTTREVPLMWPLSMLQSGSEPSPSSSPVAGRTNTMVRLSRQLFGEGIPRKFVLDRQLSDWLKDFRPQLLYSFLGSMAQIRVAAGLHRNLNVPLAVHIMDDWPNVIYRNGLFGPWIRPRVIAEFKEVLSLASLRLAICDAMSREYKTRFGYDFLPFHNAINMTEWARQSRRSWEAGSPFVVRYAGSIVEEAQREALRDVCRAIAALKGKGETVEMWVHAPLNQSAYLRHESFEGLTLACAPDPSSIIGLLSSADLLILPFNFDTRSAEYMKLSMPTKVPAYMASGTPILVYGPENSAVAEYAREGKWAWVVSEPGLDVLQSAISRLKSDARLREAYGRRAQQVATKRHDSTAVRPAFQRLLADLVSVPLQEA